MAPSTSFVYTDSCAANGSGVREPVCLKCMKNKMIGVVRMDTILTESLAGNTETEQVAELLAAATFNSASCATVTSNLEFDGTNKVFTFEIDLGKCAMSPEMITHNGEQYIKFVEELEFVAATGVVFFGEVGKFKYTCNYKATSSTNSMQYEVINRRIGNEAEQFVTWDNGMNINFYTDNTFTTKMSPHSLIVGNRFNFEVDWLETFTSSMPVVFYATDCTVTNAAGDTTFDIIKSGCKSDLVQATRHAGPYVSDKLQTSYKSFAFLKSAGSFELKLSCNVAFCLSADQTAGTCGFDATSCPTTYTA